jgi:hypothetical protein
MKTPRQPLRAYPEYENTGKSHDQVFCHARLSFCSVYFLRALRGTGRNISAHSEELKRVELCMDSLAYHT